MQAQLLTREIAASTCPVQWRGWKTLSEGQHHRHASFPSSNAKVINFGRVFWNVRDTLSHGAAINGIIGVVSAELEKLGKTGLRDARAPEACGAINIFLDTWARPTGLVSSPILAIPKNMFAPNPSTPDGGS